jgi:hypothetical protein
MHYHKLILASVCATNRLLIPPCLISLSARIVVQKRRISIAPFLSALPLCPMIYKESSALGPFLLSEVARKDLHVFPFFPEAAHEALLYCGHIIELNSLCVPLRNLFPSFNYLLIVFLRYDLPVGCVMDAEEGETGRG